MSTITPGSINAKLQELPSFEIRENKDGSALILANTNATEELTQEQQLINEYENFSKFWNSPKGYKAIEDLYSELFKFKLKIDTHNETIDETTDREERSVLIARYKEFKEPFKQELASLNNRIIAIAKNMSLIMEKINPLIKKRERLLISYCRDLVSNAENDKIKALVEEQLDNLKILKNKSQKKKNEEIPEINWTITYHTLEGFKHRLDPLHAGMISSYGFRAIRYTKDYFNQGLHYISAGTGAVHNFASNLGRRPASSSSNAIAETVSSSSTSTYKPTSYCSNSSSSSSAALNTLEEEAVLVSQLESEVTTEPGRNDLLSTDTSRSNSYEPEKNFSSTPITIGSARLVLHEANFSESDRSTMTSSSPSSFTTSRTSSISEISGDSTPPPILRLLSSGGNESSQIKQESESDEDNPAPLLPPKNEQAILCSLNTGASSSAPTGDHIDDLSTLIDSGKGNESSSRQNTTPYGLDSSSNKSGRTKKKKKKNKNKANF